MIVGDAVYGPSRDHKNWTGYHTSQINASGRIAVACAETMGVAFQIADEVFAHCDGQIERAARYFKIEEIFVTY